MDRNRLDRWCEWGIFGLVLSILCFGPLAFGAVRTLEFVIIQSLTLAAVALWIIRIWIKEKFVLFWPPVCWAVLAFCIYAIVRYQLAPIEYVARLELIKVLTYALLFVIIINNLNRQESAQFIVVTMIGLALVLSVFGIFQIITSYNKVWNMIKPGGYALRASGTYINPNSFAGFLELILPLGLACTLLGKFSHASKVVLGYASLVILVALGATLSRGAWISCTLVLLIFFGILIFRRDFQLKSAVILAVLFGIGIGVVASTERIQKRFKDVFDKGVMQGARTDYWRIGTKLWQENIWLGAGPGHYDERYRQYRPPQLQGRPQFAHNDYVNTLADWGLVGLGIIAAFLAAFYAGILKTWRFAQRGGGTLERKKSNRAAFVLGGSLGVLAILFHSFVDFNMHVPANAILAIAIIAIVTTYLRYATESYWKSLRVPGKLIVTAIAFAGIFYLGNQALQQTREHLILADTNSETASAQRKLELLQEAFSTEPKNFQTAYSIGEIYRARSLAGKSDYEKQAEEAMLWFKRSMELNPYSPDTYIRYGMCLDWLERTNEAAKYFNRASELDPHGYYTVAHLGWHLLQVGDLEGAKEQFQRSDKLQPNQIAESYLDIIEEKLREAKQPQS